MSQAGGMAPGQRRSEIISSGQTRRLAPRPGDVLASERSARADVYTISIVPAAAHLRAGRHSEAVDKVRELARDLRVDGWFTYDHTHYARVAAFRDAEASDQRREH